MCVLVCYFLGNIINSNVYDFLRVLDFLFVLLLYSFNSSSSVIILVSKLIQLVIFLLLLFSILLFRGTLSYKLTKNRKLFAVLRSTFVKFLELWFPILQFRFQSNLFPCVCVCCVFVNVFMNQFLPFSQFLIGTVQKVWLLDLYWVRVSGVCLGFVFFGGKICFIKIFGFFSHILLLYGLLWYVVSLRRKAEILNVVSRFILCLRLCECNSRKRVRNWRTQCECLDLCVWVFESVRMFRKVHSKALVFRCKGVSVALIFSMFSMLHVTMSIYVWVYLSVLIYVCFYGIFLLSYKRYIFHINTIYALIAKS